MNRKTKKVLFIAYHFPPDAAVGALRTQKFVKYLPKYEWQPYVLTLQAKFYPATDPMRLHDVKGVTIERTSFWRTPLQFIIDIRDKCIKGKNRTSRFFQTTQESGSNINKRMSSFKSFLVGLNWLPDNKLYWLIPGIAKGLSLIKKNDIRIVVVSAPPHSSIILAYLLACLTKINLVVDFRDPWLIGNQGSSIDALKPKLLISVERTLQKTILKRASAIITTNNLLREAFLREHHCFSPEQVHVIQNGYDSSDYQSITRESPTDKYVISYLGTFYMQRTPEYFFKALSAFMHERGMNDSDLEVRLIGNIEYACGTSVKEMIKDAGLERVVRIVGNVMHRDAIRNMHQSDLLLLMASNQPLQIPAKTYEYMAAQVPILAFTEKEGATFSLINEANAGICVAPRAVEDIKAALHKLYDDYVSGNGFYLCNASLYERKRQASQLVKILENLFPFKVPEGNSKLV